MAYCRAMDTAAPSGTQWTITSSGHEAVVVEVGGGLRSYRRDGADVLYGFGEDEICPGCAGQILAPWPNRLRDGQYTFDGESYQLSLSEPERHNAIHGLVNWVRWHAVEQREDAVTLQLDMVPQLGYPWQLQLRVTWSVSADGLKAEHSVTNLSDRPAPFGLCVHPYVHIPGVAVDDLTVTVPAHSRLLSDSRLLPIGAARVAGTEYDFTEGRRLGPMVLDTAFGDLDRDADGISQVTLEAADGRGIACWADESFPWWQVYSSDTLSPARLRKAVAVEPMSCPPDAFRSGRDLARIEPGQAWQGSWGIRPLTVDR
jgi:aldose 1-epimerase